MDLQLSRQSVNLNRQIIDEKAEYAIDCEFTLPDYCPDIERILKCFITPYVNSVSDSINSVTVDGSARINILYCTKANKLFGYEIPVLVSKTFETRRPCDGAHKICEMKTGYVNCRAVNSRKVDVHGSLVINMQCRAGMEAEYICSAEEESTVLRKCDIPVSEMCGSNTKTFVLNEELNAADTNGSIENIIRYDVSSEFEDCKFVANKAIVKAIVYINILYCNQDGKYEMIKAAIPTNHIIEVDGVGENSVAEVYVSVSDVELKPYTDTDGECRSITAEIKLTISVCGYNDGVITVATDAYSTSCELDLTRKNIDFEKIDKYICTQTQVSEKIQLPCDSVSRIADVKCDISSCSCEEDDGRLVVKGSLTAFVTAVDEKDECIFDEKTIDFKSVEEQSFDSGCISTIRPFIRSCSYNIISADTIELRVEVSLCGMIKRSSTKSVLEDATADESRMKSTDNMPPLIVYYADKGESIWDIAVRYNSSVDIISRINGLSGEDVEEKMMLMIPSV